MFLKLEGSTSSIAVLSHVIFNLNSHFKSLPILDRAFHNAMTIQAVDNLGLVMTNLLKTQGKLDGLKTRLSDLNSEEGSQ